MLPNKQFFPKIGIAGYMGSGKSLCAYLCKRHLNYNIIDADRVAKSIMQKDAKIQEKLLKTFGNKIIKNSHINFHILGNLAFKSVNSLKKLNSIVHPKLLEILYKKIFFQKKSFILDAALISYWKIEDWFDLCIWVDAKKSLRLNRVIKKTGLHEKDIKQRMMIQEMLFKKPATPKWKKIQNNTTIKNLNKNVLQILDQFLQRK